MIDCHLKKVLEKIDFVERYLSLCTKHSDRENNIKDKSLKEIGELLNNINVSFSFSKKECFFKIKEKIVAYDFQFNIIPYTGALQFVWDIKVNKIRLKLGWGMWENIVEEIESIDFEIKPRPYYSNYQELEEILREAFTIYEDFKNEVLKVDWNEEDMKDSE